MRITLNGLVVSGDDQWLYDWFEIAAFSPGLVRRALADNPEGEDLELEINSPGGAVFPGFEMYSLLREAKCRTVAIVQSLAGSAASTIMAGCREVRMSPVAQVMIHLPSSYTEGNQNDMRREARVLEGITQSILNGYEAKCGGKATREKLDRLMRAETWLTAQEAVELGLADSILGQEESGAVLPQSIVNAAGAGIRALAGGAGPALDVQGLRARYEQLVRAGAAPAEGHPVAEAVEQDPAGGTPEKIAGDWRRKAKLAIERSRFMEG